MMGTSGMWPNSWNGHSFNWTNALSVSVETWASTRKDDSRSTQVLNLSFQRGCNPHQHSLDPYSLICLLSEQKHLCLTSGMGLVLKQRPRIWMESKNRTGCSPHTGVIQDSGEHFNGFMSMLNSMVDRMEPWGSQRCGTGVPNNAAWACPSRRTRVTVKWCLQGLKYRSKKEAMLKGTFICQEVQQNQKGHTPPVHFPDGSPTKVTKMFSFPHI